MQLFISLNFQNISKKSLISVLDKYKGCCYNNLKSNKLTFYTAAVAPLQSVLWCRAILITFS